MGVSSSVRVSLKFDQTGGSDFGPQRFEGEVARLLQFGSGTTANNANLLFVDERSVAASTSDPLDLAGVLSDAMGTTFAAAEIVAILVINAPISPSNAANTSNLTVGGGTNPVVGYLGGTTPTIGPIRPGGMVLLANPDASGLATVTAGTGDILNIANGSGGTAVYQVAILARTA